VYPPISKNAAVSNSPFSFTISMMDVLRIKKGVPNTPRVSQNAFVLFTIIYF